MHDRMTRTILHEIPDFLLLVRTLNQIDRIRLFNLFLGNHLARTLDGNGVLAAGEIGAAPKVPPTASTKRHGRTTLDAIHCNS